MAGSSSKPPSEPEVPEFFLATCQGYTLKLQVVPGARKTAVAGRHGDRLKIKVAAVPEKGAANEELLTFLAHLLKVPRKTLHLVGGAASRAKVVAIHDLSPDLGKRLKVLASLPP